MTNDLGDNYDKPVDDSLYKYLILSISLALFLTVLSLIIGSDPMIFRHFFFTDKYMNELCMCDVYFLF